jgi:hypothetical protein
LPTSRRPSPGSDPAILSLSHFIDKTLADEFPTSEDALHLAVSFADSNQQGAVNVMDEESNVPSGYSLGTRLETVGAITESHPGRRERAAYSLTSTEIRKSRIDQNLAAIRLILRAGEIINAGTCKESRIDKTGGRHTCGSCGRQAD